MHQLGSSVRFVLPIDTSATITNAKVGNLSDWRQARLRVCLVSLEDVFDSACFSSMGDALLMGF